MRKKIPWLMLSAATIGLLLIAGPWSRSTWIPPLIPTYFLTVGEGVQASITGDDNRFRVEIHRLKGENPWQARVDRRVRVERGRRYEATFTAQADRAKTMIVAVSQGEPPWENLGGYDEFQLSTKPKQLSFSFTAKATEDDARLTFVVGAGTGTIEVKGPIRFRQK